MRADRAFLALIAALVLAGAGALELAAGSSLFFLVTLAVCVVYYVNETSTRSRYVPNRIATILCATSPQGNWRRGAMCMNAMSALGNNTRATRRAMPWGACWRSTS